MKREARNHSKMKRLCRKLDIPVYQGVGLLESIWHVTAVEAWRGDIGKLSNEEIALAVDYRGDEDELIDALVVCGWLDESETYRLLVHDWPEHADQAVQKRAIRETKAGKSGFLVDMSGHFQTNAPNGGLPEPVPEPEPVPGAVPGSPKSALPAPSDAPMPPPVAQVAYDPDADPEDNIPDGLAPTQYAHFVLDEAAIPASNGLRLKMADALGMLARLEECTMPESTRRMLARIREEQRAGPFKAHFWLEEGKWKRVEMAGISIAGWDDN